MMKVFNERMQWLGTGGLRVFGPVVGDVVTIAVDTSHAMKSSLAVIKTHLKALLADLKHKRTCSTQILF